MALLNVNRRVGADLIADVVDQSADNLVDGVTAGKCIRKKWRFHENFVISISSLKTFSGKKNVKLTKKVLYNSFHEFSPYNPFLFLILWKIKIISLISRKNAAN